MYPCMYVYVCVYMYGCVDLSLQSLVKLLHGSVGRVGACVIVVFILNIFIQLGSVGSHSG